MNLADVFSIVFGIMLPFTVRGMIDIYQDHKFKPRLLANSEVKKA